MVTKGKRAADKSEWNVLHRRSNDQKATYS